VHFGPHCGARLEAGGGLLFCVDENQQLFRTGAVGMALAAILSADVNRRFARQRIAWTDGAPQMTVSLSPEDSLRGSRPLTCY